MQRKNILYAFAFIALIFQGCSTTSDCCGIKTKTIAIYEDDTIPANRGISTGIYTEVDGYRYVNIAVEFEQNAAQEEPMSLGVVFAHDQAGKWGARRYFTFEENFSGPANPQMITVTGNSSWNGNPRNKSTYIARFPVMGPYIQVFPFNRHSEERSFSIVLYLTE